MTPRHAKSLVFVDLLLACSLARSLIDEFSWDVRGWLKEKKVRMPLQRDRMDVAGF